MFHFCTAVPAGAIPPAILCELEAGVKAGAGTGTISITWPQVVKQEGRKGH